MALSWVVARDDYRMETGKKIELGIKKEWALLYKVRKKRQEHLAESLTCFIRH
jgi:hypothetical protein